MTAAYLTVARAGTAEIEVRRSRFLARVERVETEAAATLASPGVPGSTTSRASASASTSTAPSSRRRAATMDFPEAIPPVNPIFNTSPD